MNKYIDWDQWKWYLLTPGDIFLEANYSKTLILLLLRLFVEPVKEQLNVLLEALCSLYVPGPGLFYLVFLNLSDKVAIFPPFILSSFMSYLGPGALLFIF